MSAAWIAVIGVWLAVSLLGPPIIALIFLVRPRPLTVKQRAVFAFIAAANIIPLLVARSWFVFLIGFGDANAGRTASLVAVAALAIYVGSCLLIITVSLKTTGSRPT